MEQGQDNCGQYHASAYASLQVEGSLETLRCSLNILLVSRFDLIFLMVDPQDEAYDRRLANHLVSLYYKERSETEAEKLDMALLRDYIGRFRGEMLSGMGRCTTFQHTQRRTYILNWARRHRSSSLISICS